MKSTTKKWISALGTALSFGLCSASSCFAQISQLTSGLEWIKSTITGIGIVVIVIAIMWTGFKMMFQHAKWSEVAQIFFGGILVGGAAAIGPQLFGGGSAG